jgi:hypothetical protein
MTSEERLRTDTEPRWEGALDPEVYATILAWALAHAGRRVRVESAWWDSEAHPENDVHLDSLEGTLVVSARAIRRATREGGSVVMLAVRNGERLVDVWMYSDPDWGDGPSSAWVNLEATEEGGGRTVADAGLRVSGPQGVQTYTVATPKPEDTGATPKPDAPPPF